MAFVPNWLERVEKYVVFVEQKKNKIKDNYFFEIDSNLSATQWTDYNFNSLWINQREALKSNSLKELIPGLEVIAVFGQYSGENSQKKDPRPDIHRPDLGHGLIILFQFDRSIKYCYTYPFKISSSVRHFMNPSLCFSKFDSIYEYLSVH